MSPDKAREFYELCQAYRHTPLTEQRLVGERYQELVDFVNLLVGEHTQHVTVGRVSPEASAETLEKRLDFETAQARNAKKEVCPDCGMDDEGCATCSPQDAAQPRRTDE